MSNNVIAVNDLKRHGTAIAPYVSAAVERVLSSHWYILGEEGKAFEEEFSAYCGVPHCVGVANGTDAIEIALRALGIGKDHGVATVANAGFYTSSALAAIGAKPVFTDVDASTHLMDVDHLETIVTTQHISAIVITHLYGRMHDMPAIMALAEKHGVRVLEDCAQAHGAMIDGRRAGSFGDAASFSFYPTKNLGAIGDGGAIVTRHEDIASISRQLRQYGWQSKYDCALPGGRNSRLDELQAAVLRAKLTHLDGWNKRRREIAAIYQQRIHNLRVNIPSATSPEHVYHLFVILSEERDLLRAHLRSRNISTDIHYPIPDHRQKAYLASGQAAPSLPVTESLCGRILTLPCFPELSDAEAQRVADGVNDW